MYSTAGGAWVSIDTGAGNINIHGQGGNGADGNGVLLQGNSGINAATLRTTTGNITVTGVSGTGASSHGILAAYYSQIETAGGVLTLNGDSTGAGASRGFWSLGLIDAGTNAGSTIAGTSLNEYGVLLAPAADWRVGSGGQLNVTGEGTNGLGADGVALTLNGGTINFTGEGTSGQGVNLSGAITFAGDGGQLRFIGAGANGDVIVSGSIEATGTTGARSLEISSSGLIQLQGTPSTTTIGATVGGMLNFSATAADSLTLGGKIVTEGGAVSLVAGTKMSITAGIETFGGGISIMGNAPGGSITGANYSGAGNGVEIKRLTAATVAIDAGGGDIYIAGVAGDTGGYNIGVLIDGAQVTTTGSGDVQIYGKGGGAAGGGDSYQVGVFVNANDFFFGNSYSNSGSISAGTGGLTITGEGGSAGADGSNHGVLISKAPVTSAGFINIEGTGGSGPGSDSILIAAGSVTSTGTASDDIILLANATLGGGFGLSLADGFSNDGNSVTIGGMSFQGNLFLHANTLSATTTILELSHQSGSGTIQFQTATATLGIGINGGDAGGGMAIGAGVLNDISGFDRLVFGGSGQIGAIQMDSTNFGGYAGLASVDSFEVRTQGLFYSNTLDFNGKAVVIDTGGASGGTLTNFDSLVLTGTGGFTGTANGGTLLIDKTGTSASIDVTSASTLTLGASTMGSGTLTLSGLAITQIGPLTQDAIGGNVNFTSSGLIALGQSNTFTGTSITIEGASVQINAQQNFTRGDSQTVNLISTGGNVSVNADLVKTGMGGAHFNITADETAWFANAGIQSDGGNITIWGNAPNGDNNVSGNAGGAWGVRIDGANAILSAGAGNIDIVGKGWTDNGTGQHGIVLMNGGRLETDTGYIILSGRGGSGTGSGANGIMLGSGASIESQGGYIELYGYGGANSANANGVVLDGGSTITHAGGGYVLFMGNGANGGQGVVAAGAATVDTGAGQLSVMSNSGISLDSVLLRAGGSATFVGGAGNIALNNASNDIAGTTTFTTAVGNVSFVNSYTGTLTLGGSDVAGYLAIQTGGGIDQAGAPSHVTGATNITAGGSIELTNADNTFGGAVTLTNTGGSNDVGIGATGALTLDTVSTQASFTAQASGPLTLSGASTFAVGKNVTLMSEGAISITATQTLSGGTFTADADAGVSVTANISTSGGGINLYGNAPGGGAFGTTSGAFHGVAIDAGAIVNAGGGNITIKGAGGDTGTYHGVSVRNGAGVTTAGGGAITIDGQGGTGATGSAGVEFYDLGAYAQTEDGALTVTGTGGSTGYGNTGVALATGEIRSIGLGNVTVTGTGGGLASEGVHVGGGGATYISATDGTLTINATGGGANDSGLQSWGLAVGSGNFGGIVTTGVGNIAITATAGGMSGDSDRYGMIVGSGGTIATISGALSIEATGGMGGGTGNHAINLAGGTIGGVSMTGDITLAGDSLSTAAASIQTTGVATIRPLTNGFGIGIGGGSGGLQLGSSFSYVSAGTLKFGGASIGNIDVGAGGLNAPPATALYLHGAQILLNGDVNATGGKLTLHGDSGGVTQAMGTAVTANTLILRGTGNFTLDNGGVGVNLVEYVAADVSGPLALRTGSGSTYTSAAIATDATGTVTGISASSTLDWSSTGNIGQSTGAIVSVAGPVNLTANGGITLYEAGNTFLGPLTATNSAGTISLRAGGITVGATGISSAGDLILATTTGALQQSGGIIAGGNFYASAADGIMLSNAGNAVAGNVSLTTTGGTDATWNEIGSMSMGSLSISGSLNVSVTSGSISQVGAAHVTGTSSFTASGGVALTHASNTFGGALTLTASSGSAAITSAGALTLGTISSANGLTVTAGGALTQTGPIMLSAGTTSLSATGTMNLTQGANNFGTALALTGPGGTIDGTVNGNSGAAAVSAVTASSGSFTFGGASVSSAPPPATPTEGTTTNTVTTETLAQIITQILTSTVTQPSSSTTSTDATTVNPVSPAAVQAMLIAILSEAASPAGGGTGGGDQQSSGEGSGTQQAGAQAGAGAQSGTPSVTAETGTFGAGTTITINTSGGTVASITVTPVGGGAPVTILPGLLNLTPPAIPTATATGTPGISGNFPLAWGGR
ncbi:MAG: hypothetical protein LCH62_00415 [Proteobacteria bacterium]|nr:hypothetical protein [Pseudomonadota bacterium]